MTSPSLSARCFIADTIDGQPAATDRLPAPLLGYFERIDSERGIAWRAVDSFALRDFLGVGLDRPPRQPACHRRPTACSTTGTEQ
jgi:hypothetical protein